MTIRVQTPATAGVTLPINESDVNNLVNDLATKAVPLTDAGSIFSADFTAVANQIHRVDTTTGVKVATLPTSPAIGTRVVLKIVTQASTNGVTYNCGGSDVINKPGGVATSSLTVLGHAVTLQYIATNIWAIIGDNLPLPQLDLRYLGLAAAIPESQVTSLTTDLAAKSPLLVPTAVKTSAYTAAATDFVPVDTTSGAVTITLPTAPADKTVIGIGHVTQGSTNAVTYACGGSDVFDKTGGSTSDTLALLNQAITLQYKSSGAIWYRVANRMPLPQIDARYVTKVALSVTGALTTRTGTARFYVDESWTITSVRAAVGTAPTGASLIADVRKNGTTIYTTTANRPTIAASGFTAVGSTPDVTALVSGDYLTVDLAQVGSTIAGSDLTVIVTMHR